MKKVALNKSEKRIKHLNGLLSRRIKVIVEVRRRAEEEVKRLEGMNAMTRFEISAREKGEWPS